MPVIILAGYVEGSLRPLRRVVWLRCMPSV